MTKAEVLQKLEEKTSCPYLYHEKNVIYNLAIAEAIALVQQMDAQEVLVEMEPVQLTLHVTDTAFRFSALVLKGDEAFDKLLPYLNQPVTLQIVMPK